MPVTDNAALLRRTSAWRRWLPGAGAALLLLAAGWALVRPVGALVGLEPRDSMSDISYGSGARHKLDVYRPRGADNVPVIVFFYGGRWQSGAKGWYRFLGATLAARGYVVVVPDYRLYPEVKFPEFVMDGANALRWTQENIATFRGNPRRLFVMGHSAGAYIAAMLALDPKWLKDVGLDTDRDIAGLIGVSGPYDFLPLKDATLTDIFGGNDRAVTQPISFAEGRKPPTLLLTGSADDIVDPGNSARLADKLRRNGNDGTEVMYRRLGHITVLAAFAPVLGNLFSALDDVQAFVERATPGAQRRVSDYAGTAAP
jgi:acetyl esterase/lipase